MNFTVKVDDFINILTIHLVFFKYNGSKEATRNLWFNTISLYCRISPNLGPETLTRDHKFNNILLEGFMNIIISPPHVWPNKYLINVQIKL